MGLTESLSNGKSDESREDSASARYYVVRGDILPEALLKTMMVKELLAHGGVKTVHDAVEQIGLSRSAFYKYKDGIFPLNKLERDRIVTVTLDLEHRSGILSKVLVLIAQMEANVLTIHQTIPLQGMATAVISVDISHMSRELHLLLDALRSVDGVKKVSVVGQGRA